MYPTTLPLYPGTGFPVCPGGGVKEFPKPMQEADIGDPVSATQEGESARRSGVSVLLLTDKAIVWVPYYKKMYL